MGLNVMTQAIHTRDGSLPQGLTIPPDSEEEDPSGKISCGHMAVRASDVDWQDRGIR